MSRLLKVLILFVIIISSIIFYFSYRLYNFSVSYINKPFSLEEIKINENRALKIYDRNGILISTIFPEYGGFYEEVYYTNISTNLINAVISAEDKNFFYHKGIDISSILRAFFYNLKSRRIVSGGSTITQQLAKNLTPRERTYINKFYEALDAIRLEKNLSKEEIITSYLNRVFLGNNAYGVGAASKIYFKKDVGDLTVNEASVLASIIKSGTMYNPYRYIEMVDSRRKYVLNEMLNNHYIKENEYYDYISNMPFIYSNNNYLNNFNAYHFSTYVKQNMKKLNYDNVIEVNTTLDLNMQENAITIIRNSSQSLHKFNVRNIACIILDAKTLEILTMIGSMNYFDKETDGAFNGATSLRQAGSTLKPFLYAYLFDKGETPASVIGDTKTYIESPGGDYIPENFDHKYRGPVTIRYALANSLNIPAVKWVSRYSLSEFQNILLKSGLSSINKNPDYYGASLVLGSAEVRLLDLAAAYGVFINNGYFINHSSIRSIKKENSQIIKLNKNKKTKVISSESAYLINSILSDKNIRQGSFRTYRGLVYPFSIAIKTGTSKGSRDAWGVAYNDKYIVALWLGDFKGSEMINITGGNGAVPIIYDLFSMLNKEQKETIWNKPNTIVTRDICLISGKLKTEYCKESIVEEFDSKNVIQEYCNVHNLYIRENSDGSISKKVFVNLSSEYDNWLKQQQIEKPTDEWVLYDNYILRNKDTQYSSFYKKEEDKDLVNKISIKSPLNNSVYKIDDKLPIEYQNIYFSFSLPNNLSDANFYCNDEKIANYDDIINNNIKWQLKKGEYKFYIIAKYESDKEVRSASVSIFVN